jgi:hypothetical protein
MVIERLNELGIRVQNKPGEQRTTCPKCSHLRTKKRDRCLSVKIDADGGTFNCWHCGFSGGVSEDGARRAGVGVKTRDQRGDFGLAGRRLRYGVLS